MKATMGTPDDYGCKKKSLEALQQVEEEEKEDKGIVEEDKDAFNE